MTTLDDLLQLWEDRRDSGITITPEELCTDSPEFLSELKWTIQALEAVESRFGVIRNEPEPSAKESPERPGPEFQERVLVPSEYRIERLHASGGLGSVYLAKDPVLNRRVAIKFPRWQRLTKEQAARFEREARVTGRLDHPGIIPVHAMRSDNADRPCYVMRFVDGETLQSRIRKLHADGPLRKSAEFFEATEFRQLLQNLVTVCNIAAYAHEQGVIHRDIKPANIMPGPFGEVLLLDWGLAKVLGESSDDLLFNPLDMQTANLLETREGQALGTPAFASPEQLLGRTDDVTQLTDVYSLGATLFVLLTGSISSGSSAFHEHLNRLKQGRHFSVHELNPSIPAALEAICRHAMAIHPQDRYQSALLLAEDLNRYLAGEAVSVNRDPALVRLGRWIRHRPGLAAASATGILFASLAGMVGSAVLGQKNQELRAGNEKLVEAVEDSREANVQTLEALRILFDDVVTQKLGSQTELTAVDRDFLHKIRQQYEVFASLKGDSIESREIRAEGLQQSGTILMQLGEEQEARSQFDAAAEHYEQLMNDTGDAKYRRQLATTLINIGDSQQNSGELAFAEQTADRGLSLLAPILKESSDAADIDAWEVCAQLHQMKGSIQITLGRWDQALKSYTASKDIFERRRNSDGDSRLTLSRLAKAYRSMGDVCQNLGNVNGQEEHSANASKYYRTLMDMFPEDRTFVKGFCWAVYDRSYSHELFERHSEAFAELSEAVTAANQMAEKFPLSDEFRGVHASMQVRRAGINSRMGHYSLAKADLQQAIQKMEKMVGSASNSAQSYRQLIKAVRMLAILQHSYGHLRDAEETARRMKVHGDEFTAAFPEAAARSWELGSLQYDLAMILADGGRLDEAELTVQNWLDSIGDDADVLAGDVFSASSLESRCGLIKVQIWKGHLPKVKELADSTAAYIEKIQTQLSEESTNWDILPDYHLQLSNFYHSLGDVVQCSHHESQQLAILDRVAKKALYPPAGQVRIVNALIERADVFIERGQQTVAMQQLEAASTTLNRAFSLYPDDVSLQTALDDLNVTRGRFAFDQQQYAEALRFFDDVMKGNPSTSDRSIRILCMAHLKDAGAYGELEKELERPVEATSLPDLIRACGIMASETADESQIAPAVAAARQLLDRANSEGVFLKPRVLARLRASKELAALMQHHAFTEAISRLDTASAPQSK